MVSMGAGYESNNSKSDSKVWGQQSPYLQELYQRGNKNMLKQQGAVEGYAKNFTDTNMPMAQNAINNIGDSSYTDSITQGSNLGMKTFANQMNPEGNPYLEQQITNMRGNMANDMNTFGMMDNRTAAQMSGQYGGDRQGVADYLTRKDAAKRASEAEITMRSNNYQSDMNRANNAAGSYLSSGLGANQQSVNDNMSSLDAMNSVYNLGMNPYQASWMPMMNQSAITKDPVIESRNRANGSAFNYNFGVG